MKKYWTSRDPSDNAAGTADTSASDGASLLSTRLGVFESHTSDLFSSFRLLPQPLSGMQEDPASGATADAADRAASAERLLARLSETETLLAAERASNQVLNDELLRVRSETIARAAGAAGVTGRENSVSAAAAAATEDADLPPPPPVEKVRRRNKGDDERPRPPWQNVLYKRQPYADNHVPDSFLEKLVTNGEGCANHRMPQQCRLEYRI